MYPAMASPNHNNRLKTRLRSLASLLYNFGYKLGRMIGEGSFSKVKEAEKRFPSGQFGKVACKIIDKKRASPEYVTHFLPRELTILKALRHENLVRVYDVIEAHDQVFIFMEICRKGDLLDFITNNGPIPEIETRKLFQQIVSGLKYIHSCGVSHRDLKCENILIKEDNTIKITDFGFARYCHDATTNKRILSDTVCGSLAYTAPEIIQGFAYNPKMADIWALGCILYVMLTANLPFDVTNVTSMLRVQLDRSISFSSNPDVNISYNMRKLIMHLLEPNTLKRATIQQVDLELKKLPPLVYQRREREQITYAHNNRYYYHNQNRRVPWR